MNNIIMSVPLNQSLWLSLISCIHVLAVELLGIKQYVNMTVYCSGLTFATLLGMRARLSSPTLSLCSPSSCDHKVNL
jgi:uncharacterized membrane protein